MPKKQIKNCWAVIINKQIQNCSLNIEMLFLPLGFGFLKFSLVLSKTRLTRDLNGNESVMKKIKKVKEKLMLPEILHGLKLVKPA